MRQMHNCTRRCFQSKDHFLWSLNQLLNPHSNSRFLDVKVTSMPRLECSSIVFSVLKERIDWGKVFFRSYKLYTLGEFSNCLCYDCFSGQSLNFGKEIVVICVYYNSQRSYFPCRRKSGYAMEKALSFLVNVLQNVLCGEKSPIMCSWPNNWCLQRKTHYLKHSK